MRKCAERCVDGSKLAKIATVEGWGASKALAYGVPAAAAGLLGAGAGAALTKDKKKKLRNALIIAILASGAGAGLAHANMSRVGNLADTQGLVDAANAGAFNVKFDPAVTALNLHGLLPKEE